AQHPVTGSRARREIAPGDPPVDQPRHHSSEEQNCSDDNKTVPKRHATLFDNQQSLPQSRAKRWDKPCSAGVRSISRLRQRSTSCEAVLERVPEGDLVLAEPPAEQDLFITPEGGKVDEALVEILDEQSQLLQRRGAANDFDCLLVDRRLQLVDLVRPDAAAVAGDLRRDPR